MFQNDEKTIGQHHPQREVQIQNHNSFEGIILTDFEIDKGNRNNHTGAIINLIIREYFSN